MKKSFVSNFLYICGNRSGIGLDSNNTPTYSSKSINIDVVKTGYVQRVLLLIVIATLALFIISCTPTVNSEQNSSNILPPLSSLAKNGTEGSDRQINSLVKISTPEALDTRVEYLYASYSNGRTPVSISLPQVDFETFLAESTPATENYTEIYQANYSYPIHLDPLSKQYIRYYTGPGRRTFQMWLDRSNRYIDLVKNILYEEGIPVDFMALPFAESGYSTEAVSWVGATGIWQFMPRTGIYYGLKQDFWQDDRKDFEASTRAAAKYLQDSYRRFGDWHISTASYNAGATRLSRAMRNAGSNDFYVVNQGSYLAKETRHYVPKYTALLIIYKNYLEYGFTMPQTEPMIYKTVDVPSQSNLYVVADTLGISVGELREFNPAVLHPITPPGAYTLRIPVSVSQPQIDNLSAMSAEELIQFEVHYGSKGQEISTIANRYGVSISELTRLNALSGTYLTASQPILVPLDGYYDRQLNKWFQLNAKPGSDLYLVRSGDSLESIARKFNMDVEELTYLNGKRSYTEIIPGLRIIIPR